MAYDTKTIFSLIASVIAKSQTLEEAYITIMEAANVEGIALKSYEEAVAANEEIRNKAKKNNP